MKLKHLLAPVGVAVMVAVAVPGMSLASRGGGTPTETPVVTPAVEEPPAEPVIEAPVVEQPVVEVPVVEVPVVDQPQAEETAPAPAPKPPAKPVEGAPPAKKAPKPPVEDGPVTPNAAPDAPVAAEAPDSQGCTPGYWKNHDLAWAGNNTGYDPDDLVVAVWSVPAGLVDGSDTLLDALNYDGGEGPAGMARNLLRHAAAALLNANATGVEYLYTGATVIADTDSALASGQRPNMEQVKNRWNDANQTGCPL